MNHCKDCRWWNTNEHLNYELRAVREDCNGEWGRCEVDSDLFVASYDSGTDGDLITQATFGCVLFEAKEGQ